MLQNSGFKVLCIPREKRKEMNGINTLEEEIAEACKKVQMQAEVI